LQNLQDSANVGWRGRAGVAHNSWLQNFNKKRMSGAATESGGRLLVYMMNGF